MKRIILALFAVLAALAVASGCPAYADNIGNGNSVDASANVPSNLSPYVVVDLRRVASQEGTPAKGPYGTNTSPATSMDFGTLSYQLKNGDLAGGFFSEVSYCAVTYVTPFNGKTYIIKSKGELTSTDTPNNDIANAFLLTAYYEPNDLLIYDAKNPAAAVKQGDPGPGEEAPTTALYKPALQENDNLMTGNKPHVLQLWYSFPSPAASGKPYFGNWKPLPYSLPGNTPISAKVTVTVYTTT